MFYLILLHHFIRQQIDQRQAAQSWKTTTATNLEKDLNSPIPTSTLRMLSIVDVPSRIGELTMQKQNLSEYQNVTMRHLTAAQAIKKRQRRNEEEV